MRRPVWTLPLAATMIPRISPTIGMRTAKIQPRIESVSCFWTCSALQALPSQ